MGDSASGSIHPPTAAPTSPAHPPRPSIEALPKPVQEVPVSLAPLKHPLPQPAQQGPPNKQVRHKPFPGTGLSAPCPKGPRASFMPTPEQVQRMDTCAAAAATSAAATGKIYQVHSAADIDWSRRLCEQLEPNLSGGPDKTKPLEELCMLRSLIPKLDKNVFQKIFPSDNIVRVTQKTHGVHYVHLSEAATWVINGAHWFSVLKQPMMVVIWCRDWEDAAKFQYLMQILQVTLGNYVPRITSLSSKRKKSISWPNIGNSPQLHGMEVQSVGSCQRPISMIYRQLVPSTSIQCGPFLLLLLIRIGSQWHSECPHGIWSRRLIDSRKPCRVNHPSLPSSPAIWFKP